MGSGIEVVLLSLALADRINILKRQTVEAQKNELNALRENEKLVTEQNLILEQRVNERTQALKEANDQLASALQDLKNAQVQLVNAEKLASLGQLTAGIAHEINNPINFEAASVIPLRQDFADVETLIHKYETRLKELVNQEVYGEFEMLKKELDADYCLQEIKNPDRWSRRRSKANRRNRSGSEEFFANR